MGRPSGQCGQHFKPGNWTEVSAGREVKVPKAKA